MNLDRRLEPESLLKVTLPLRAFGDDLIGDFQADCRVILPRPLVGGTCVLGLEFQDLAQEHRESLGRIIEHWAGKLHLKRCRHRPL